MALSIIFADETRAADSFKRYKKCGYDLDAIYGPDGACLIPLLARRITALFPSDEWCGRMQGYARHVWTLNQRELHNLGCVLRALRERNVPFLLLNDAAILGHFENVGMRKLFCQQLLIAPHHVTTAQNIVKDTNVSKEVDIQVVSRLQGALETIAWDGKRQIVIADLDVDALGPVAQFLQRLLCVRAQDLNQTLWFIDVANLIEAMNSPADHEDLMKAARGLHISLPILRAWSLFDMLAKEIGYTPNLKIRETMERMPLSEREIADRAFGRLKRKITGIRNITGS